MAKEKIIVEKNKKNKVKNNQFTNSINQANEMDLNLGEKPNKKTNKFKKFFYGVGKEFERTSWTTKSKLMSDFFVVIIIVLILAAIFTGIGLLMVTYVK